MNSKARIAGLGTYVPGNILTNHDLEEMVDTSDEWIVRVTGIHERRIADQNQFTSDLAKEAVKSLMRQCHVTVEDVDLIIVCTTTPDFSFPNVASQIQDAFRIKSAGAMDLSAACAGFTYGLHVANGLISSGLHRKVLVIGAETISKITDYTDRTTCILFGDGAGAALLEFDEEHPSFIQTIMGTDGSGGEHVYRSAMSNTMNGTTLKGTDKLVQNGREVYKWALKTIPEKVTELLNLANLTIDDIDWFIPHSANLRMIEAICERLNMPMEKTLYSVDQFGNTSLASIPLALEKGIKSGQIKKNDKIILYGFGGGLTHCGQLITWPY
ncbi:ketoacyl-ACP synthase III [Terrilactibacillus laevilacticus]|uniref:Beta-ketoacyl-[acyl-carrier-protein] synthase III n=1 Tax=Terrilactibacillus laevilacticus TaxID=1380157 RepID=A0ABW5PUC7_9BACI|nr:ketoacyl-ACP synthase III [Terrilactibacillus laevilacticus]